MITLVQKTRNSEFDFLAFLVDSNTVGIFAGRYYKKTRRIQSIVFLFRSLKNQHVKIHLIIIGCLYLSFDILDRLLDHPSDSQCICIVVVELRQELPKHPIGELDALNLPQLLESLLIQPLRASKKLYSFAQHYPSVNVLELVSSHFFIRALSIVMQRLLQTELSVCHCS